MPPARLGKEMSKTGVPRPTRSEPLEVTRFYIVVSLKSLMMARSSRHSKRRPFKQNKQIKTTKKPANVLPLTSGKIL